MKQASSSNKSADLRTSIDCLAGLSVEQLRCYRIATGDERVFPVPAEMPGRLGMRHPAKIWIDIQASHPGDVQVFFSGRVGLIEDISSLGFLPDSRIAT